VEEYPAWIHASYLHEAASLELNRFDFFLNAFAAAR
jgi:hypothetical protein